MKGRHTRMITRAMIRYYGGKARIAPWILSHFGAHEAYVEAFGGAASVLLRKPRVRCEIYNDIDDEVVNLFQIVRDPGLCKDLQNALRLTPFSRREFERAYLPTKDRLEQARRYLVRAYMGHGSTGGTHHQRTGFMRGILSRGNGAQPPSTDWANYPAHLPAFCERLRSVTIEALPAVDLLPIYDTPKTLFYLDPPYVTSSRRHSGDGYRHEMTDADHRALSAVARSLKGMVVLSGYPSPLYDELYGDWKRFTCASRADRRGARIEAVWLNPAAYAAMPRRLEI